MRTAAFLFLEIWSWTARENSKVLELIYNRFYEKERFDIVRTLLLKQMNLAQNILLYF